jgi:hypothetical protein
VDLAADEEGGEIGTDVGVTLGALIAGTVGPTTGTTGFGIVTCRTVLRFTPALTPLTWLMSTGAKAGVR